jgi:cytochrome P450
LIYFHYWQVIEDRRRFLKSTKKVSSQKNGGDDDDVGTKKRNLAFLDLLLMAQDEGEQYMSNKDIRDEVSTFMFEVRLIY